MRRILKNAPAKSAIIFFSQLLRFFLTFRSAYATICSVANRIIICSNISALPKMLAKASMRNTNFKKYAGLFRRPPNVANRIRLRRAASNAHIFNKISYAGLSKRSQRGGLENLSVKRTINSRNPLISLTISPLQKSQNYQHLTQYLTLSKFTI